MKLPRKVIIAGQEWRVIKEPKEYGGRLEALELTMWIGTKRKCHIFPTFLHEVFEAICIMRDVRYSGHTEGDYLFSMNH